MTRKVRHVAVLAATLAALAAGVVPAIAEQRPAARCRDAFVPVALDPGTPAGHRVFGRLCEPAGGKAATVQVLVHGITYDHGYWDVPDPTGRTDRYSYVRAANAAGFATFAIDRIGIGRSSHPPGAAVGIHQNAFVVHQVIGALRAGRVGRPVGRGGFGKVVLVGHSYGTWTSWFEATRWRDADAVILSAATHRVHVPAVPNVGSTLRPALLEPRLAALGVDAGYLTTAPGTRYRSFYAPAEADPAVVAHDEATKQTITVREIADFPETMTAPLDIRAPVLLAGATLDRLFCGDPGGTDCSSAEALRAGEAEHLGDHVPCLDVYVLPGGGHDLNMAMRAREWFAAANRFAERRVGSGPGPAPGCRA